MSELEAREDAAPDSRWAPDPMPALRRAARRAREIAKQAGTPLVVVRDGRVVLLDPNTEPPEIGSSSV